MACVSWTRTGYLRTGLSVMSGAGDDLTQRANARIGVVLSGKYRLDHVLGIGGMAVVYAATHLRNADRVAVKVLHLELSIDAGQRARFLREGYAANTVGHPGTVRVLDDDIAEDGSVFIVMDLLDGETLHTRWERSGGKLGVREVVTLMTELLDVLDAAHAKGIIHRDLKPENLFLTREGKLKVLDFGVARLREASLTQTRTGALFGTPAFMPPEQALGRTSEVDAQSDVWAVGATAFMLLAGRFVHQGRTQEEMLVLSATQPAAPLASVVPDVPPILAEIIDRALSFEKMGRWPSAKEMRDALVAADKIVRAGDEPDELEDRDDDKTSLALPPEMTLRGEVEPPVPPGPPEDTLELPTLEGPTLRAASTVAGVESHSQPERARRGFPVVTVVVGGIGISVAVALFAALYVGSKPLPVSAVESAASLPRSGGAAVASSAPATSSVPTASSPPRTPAPDVEPPAVDVETLPLAPRIIIPATPPTPAPQAPPEVVAKPIVTAPPPRPTPPPRAQPPAAPTVASSATNRDPLAP